MGCVQPAVLEFDEEVRAPWRPRLVAAGSDDEALRPPRLQPPRRSGSRVGVCRPAESPAPARRGAPPVGGRPGAVGPSVLSRPGRVGPARPRSGRLRLTRRARRLAVLVLVSSGVALGSWLGPLLNGGDGELRLAGVQTMVVQPGDTLWSIAASLDGEGDVRALIDDIQELNGLNGAVLVPGQTLLLP